MREQWCCDSLVACLAEDHTSKATLRKSKRRSADTIYLYKEASVVVHSSLSAVGDRKWSQLGRFRAGIV
jgi:hypothetical protein